MAYEISGWLASAEWMVIRSNLQLFLMGSYPEEAHWRIWACLLTLTALLGGSFGIWWQKRPAATLLASPQLLQFMSFSTEIRLLILALSFVGFLGLFFAKPQHSKGHIIGWCLLLPFTILMVNGALESGPFEIVGTHLWGGLLLTILLAIVGIVFSFPLGVLLALGRQSSLPAIRWFSVAYIEFIRGVPLVTILFMMQVMLPLFLPVGFSIDRVIRAMIGLTCFSAAYVAECVRGGLQVIPKGQGEAAAALGMTTLQTTRLIILPQALRVCLPVLVTLFVRLFKDTSLVAVVGLLELLGIAHSVLANPKFLGLHQEVYLFIGLVYWGLSFSLSYAAKRLEVQLAQGRNS